MFCGSPFLNDFDTPLKGGAVLYYHPRRNQVPCDMGRLADFDLLTCRDVSAQRTVDVRPACLDIGLDLGAWCHREAPTPNVNGPRDVCISSWAILVTRSPSSTRKRPLMALRSMVQMNCSAKLKLPAIAK